MSKRLGEEMPAGPSIRKKILIVAGEASGDLYGARLIREVKKIAPVIDFFGIGGEGMRGEGLSALFFSEEISVVGLVEVVLHLKTIKRALKTVIDSIGSMKPDLVVLIDFPDFNFRVARAAGAAGVPVYYYISPQVWAWRRGRVKTLARLVDRMVVIFPFEVDIYKEAGVDVRFLGHPLVDVVTEALGSVTTKKRARPTVALLPGSRRGEIQRHMPVILGAAEIIRRKLGDVDFTIPLAPTLVPEDIEPYLAASSVPVKVLRGAFHQVVKNADAVVVSSGTATVETALLGTPMVVIYRLNPITYFLARLLIRVPFIAMVNLIAGRLVVPELIQHEASAERIAREVITILTDDGANKRMREGLLEVKGKIGGPGASARIAANIVEYVTHEG